MTERLHLSPKHQAVIEALLREHLPGVEVWAYGSRVNGRSHDGSDLDLVLRGPDSKEIPVEQMTDFQEAMRDSTIPFLVETCDWARLPEEFQREIERGYVVLVEEESGRCFEWSTQCLGDVAEIVMGQSPPGETVSESHGLALLNGPTEFGAHHPIPVQFTTDARKYAQEGDLLFCVRGSTTGRMNWADQRYAIGRGVAAIRHRHETALQPFIRAVIEFELPKLLTQATGSTFPNVSAHQLAAIPYPNLDEEEQRAIAHILGTLDDKIELNRRMNETLEAIARALFKSWFVDFDPVRAKAALRGGGDWSVERARAYLDGMDPEIAALFPDRFVDSELGEIPAGWGVGKLGDVAENPRRGVQPDDIELGTSYIALEHMPKRCVALSEWDTTTGVGSNKYAFRRGEFLFGKLRPYFHKVGIAPVEGVCSTDIVVISPNANLWSSFVLLSISSDEFVAYTDQTSTGTKMPRTSWHTMKHFEVCFPSESLTTLFQEIAQPMLDRIVANCHESRALVTLRDALLPQLASGKLRAHCLKDTRV